ncbi:hypothetical protein [Pseudomonas sp. NPDC089569]|uniref:hypothetical protein n=1 Tax=Pseudomonas sp. NPDC089569 TaxID=3390722 RepID=UPI003CFD9635
MATSRHASPLKTLSPVGARLAGEGDLTSCTASENAFAGKPGSYGLCVGCKIQPISEATEVSFNSKIATLPMGGQHDANAPARACGEAKLADPALRVEVIVCAARN